jgi:MOSC domain-containing protein YiiM
MSARVASVNLGPRHRFSKMPVQCISLLVGLGVAGDAHCGEYVKHRSRARWTPRAPNLRQVHLMHRELFDELKAAGYAITSGDMGENVTTEGIDLLALPTGARLHLGLSAVVEVTGLRNPCVQMDRFAPGLMQAVLERKADGTLIRKSGVMGIVLTGGDVRAGDAIAVELPAGKPLPLKPV